MLQKKYYSNVVENGGAVVVSLVLLPLSYSE